MSTSSKPTWSMELAPGQPMLHKETLSHRVVLADGFNSSTLRREGRSRGSLILRLAWSTEIIPEQSRPLYSETPVEERGRHSRSKWLRKPHAVSVVPSSYISNSSLLHEDKITNVYSCSALNT